MNANNNYRTIAAAPQNVRWDTPDRNQGQVVEVSFADYPKRSSQAGVGSMHRRTIDHSDGSITYAKRVGGEWV